MKIKSLLFLAAICFCSLPLVGQPGGGDPNGGGKPGVPITGIEYLIAAGGLYGAKKFLGRSKKKNSK